MRNRRRKKKDQTRGQHAGNGDCTGKIRQRTPNQTTRAGSYESDSQPFLFISKRHNKAGKKAGNGKEKKHIAAGRFRTPATTRKADAKRRAGEIKRNKKNEDFSHTRHKEHRGPYKARTNSGTNREHGPDGLLARQSRARKENGKNER